MSLGFKRLMSFPLVPIIFLHTLFPNTLNLLLSPQCERPRLKPMYKPLVMDYNSIHFNFFVFG